MQLTAVNKLKHSWWTGSYDHLFESVDRSPRRERLGLGSGGRAHKNSAGQHRSDSDLDHTDEG